MKTCSVHPDLPAGGGDALLRAELLPLPRPQVQVRPGRGLHGQAQAERGHDGGHALRL